MRSRPCPPGRSRSVFVCARVWVGAAALAVVLSSDAPQTLRAQGTCQFGTSCSQAEKDKVDGICCPAPTGKKPPAIVTPPKPPPPPPAPTCSDGKVVAEGNTCCWPKQRAIAGKCRGIPTCPAGFKTVGEECAALECTGGRVRPPKSMGKCCWPGQDWSPADSRCIGIPSICPAGTEPSGEDCVPDDTDGDGIKNKVDKCPTVPEDKDGFQDDDGCPDPDDDGDGIPDAKDQCPRQAEDKNGFKDDDGCPDDPERTADPDHDGIIAQTDKCPNEPEDKDGIQDDDGCPEVDGDGDGVLDAKDKCPGQMEDMNGLKDDDGCPDQGEKGHQEVELGNWKAEVQKRENARVENYPWLIGGGLVMTGGIAMLVGQIFVRKSVYDGGFATGADIAGAISGADALRIIGFTLAGAGGIVHVVALGFVFGNMGPAKPKFEEKASNVELQVSPTAAGLRIHY